MYMLSIANVCYSVYYDCSSTGKSLQLSADLTETWRYDWAYGSKELINFW